MADLKCEKCGKEYKHSKRLDNHVASCDGSQESKTEKPERAAKPRKIHRTKGAGKKVVQTSVTESVLAMLKDKRDLRLAEISAGDEQLVEIDRVIGALEGRPI